MYMKEIPFRGIANARISARLRQVVVLVIAIVIGMIISSAVNAQDFQKKTNGTTGINSESK